MYFIYTLFYLIVDFVSTVDSPIRPYTMTRYCKNSTNDKLKNGMRKMELSINKVYDSA